MIATAAVDPGRARDDVREILDGRRFHPSKPPQPLKGLLEWIGSMLEKVFGPVRRFFAPVFKHVPAPLGWLLFAAGFAALVALIATMAIRRAARRLPAVTIAESATRVVISPDELEQLADDAERSGDLSLSLRLRFRAGLLRLDQDAHAIDLRPGLTTHDVREQLHSPRFDGLADTFEEVAYAGRSAEPREVLHARGEWPRLVKESRRG